MRTKTLYVRVDLMSGDDDDSFDAVDEERLHRALCRGFPYATSDQIRVTKYYTGKPEPLSVVVEVGKPFPSNLPDLPGSNVLLERAAAAERRNHGAWPEDLRTSLAHCLECKAVGKPEEHRHKRQCSRLEVCRCRHIRDLHADSLNSDGERSASDECKHCECLSFEP